MLHQPPLAVLAAASALSACSSTATLTPAAFSTGLNGRPSLHSAAIVSQGAVAQAAPSPAEEQRSAGGYGEQRPQFHIELSATPRDQGDDDLYGIGIYGEHESGWGGGLQIHSTFEQTSPEVQPFFGSFSGELDPRTTEFVFDIVGSRRINQFLSVFAGAGISTRERYRRFLDDAGNDFFVRVNRNVRGNFTGGVHLWPLAGLSLSAQYDSAFEAATFAIGYRF